MKYLSLLLFIIAATVGVHVEGSIDSPLLEKDAPETITSLSQIEQISKDTQNFFWKIVPPASDDPFYLHPDNTIRAVDWSSKEWPKTILKQMFAEMKTVNSSMYPVYRLTVIETRTGELVYYNSYDQEVWRTPAPLDYNPYLFAFEQFDVASEDELTHLEKIYGRSSNVGTEILLLPKDFMASFEEDSAMEAQAASLAISADKMLVSSEEDESVSVSIALVPAEMVASSLVESEEVTESMAMSFSPPSLPVDTNSVPGGGSTSNLLVELSINLPEGFGHMGHIEILCKDNLVYSTNWALATDGGWVPTLGRQVVKWIDSTSSNKACSFFFISDGADTDGDGHSDLHESISGTDSNSFNVVDTEGGVGDGINDWWETKLFGDLSQTLLDDTDGDGLTNNVEIIVDSSGRLVAMLSDPNLQDSDADEVDDYDERRVWLTDPLNPDSDDDGLEDGAEVLGSPPSDPNNSDTTAPTVVFLGH